MIKKFSKVSDKLYRGAAPSPQDVIVLRKKYNITKIISLDLECGLAIKNVCKKLGIKHIIIDLDCSNIFSLKNLLKLNIHNLINKKDCIFVHCLKGKDRTGLFIALVRCLLNGWTFNKALNEARLFGFGTGIDPVVKKTYTNIIRRACEDRQDVNEAYDIVTNMSDFDYVYRDEQFDSYDNSWAPFADYTYIKYPGNFVELTPYEEQYESRENYGLKDINTGDGSLHNFPSVGAYDQNIQLTNAIGPSFVGGGFI